MSIRLDGIHFLVTYRCTYACEHCFLWCGAEAESTMTLAQLEGLMGQAAECGIRNVYFEGGEPTLAYPVVLEAARYAQRAGLAWGLVTNCYWATSVEDAMVWLRPLADLEISDLSLSSYAYFVEDADETKLRNAVVAARKLGLSPAVLEVGAPACIEEPRTSPEDVAAVMHKGRAAEKIAPHRASRPPRELVTCPYEDFADPGRAHVGADGELQICQGISAGNVLANGIAAVLDAYDPTARPIIRELLAGGPVALAEAHGHTPLRALYADECHLCYEVRAALRSQGRHPDVLLPSQCYGG